MSENELEGSGENYSVEWNPAALNAEAITLTNPRVTRFVIPGDDGKPLLTIHTDGRVEGAVEDASEAGRVFVEYLRKQRFG